MPPAQVISKKTFTMSFVFFDLPINREIECMYYYPYQSAGSGGRDSHLSKVGKSYLCWLQSIEVTIFEGSSLTLRRWARILGQRMG